MVFEQPVFLLALLLTALPAALYMSRYVSSRKEVFPAAVFLFSRDMTPLRRLRSRQIAVTFVRMGVVILLGLAFAEPVTTRGAAAFRPAGEQQFVLVVDRSASMAAAARDGTLLDQARSLALDVVAGNPAGRFRIQPCPPGPRTVGDRAAGGGEQDRWVSAQAARRSLVELEQQSGTCRLSRTVRSIAAEADRTACTRVFSDFQATASGEEAALAALAAGHPGLEYVPVLPGRRNLSLETLGAAGDGLAFSLGNASGKAGKTALTVRCGEAKYVQEVELPESVARVAGTLPAMPAEVPSGVCEVALPDDGFAADGKGWFERVREGDTRVLIVDGTPSGVHAGSPSFFLASAIKAGSDGYSVVRLGQSEFSYGKLGLASILVLVDPLPLPGYLQQGILDQLRKGARLWILAGTNMAQWPADNRLFPGARFRPCVTVEDHPFRLEWVAREDPLVRVLADASPSHVRGWTSTRHTAMSWVDQGAEVLARFSDGTPAFLRARVDAGEVVFWSLIPEASNGDFAYHPLFPLAVSSVVQGLARPRARLEVPRDCEAGRKCRPGAEGASAPPVYEGGAVPGGVRRLLPSPSGEVECSVPGPYYALSGGQRRLAFTCVIPAAERSPARLDASVLSGSAAGRSVPAGPIRRNRHAPWLAGAALLLLFAEVWLVTRRMGMRE